MKNENAQRVPEEFKQTNVVYVRKWIDYSTKYGLSYVLSSGIIGLHFNDNTKMVSSLTQPEMVEYITKNAEQRDMTVMYHQDNFPQEMKKKITLFKHFKKYFNKNKDKKDNDIVEFQDRAFLKNKIEIEDEPGDDAKPS